MRADVSGKIMMKTYLTGMPECKFGMNDKLVMDRDAKQQQQQKGQEQRQRPATGIAIDDVTFHRYTRPPPPALLLLLDHCRTTRATA